MPASSPTLPAQPSPRTKTAPSRQSNVPPALTAGFVALSGLGLLSPNPLLTAASILVLFLLFKLLWRPGEPPILLLVGGFQWVQATARVFFANLAGVPIEELAPMISLEKAAWLSLIGIIALALGMKAGLLKFKSLRRCDPYEETQRFSIDKAFTLYLIGAGSAAFVGGFAWLIPGLTQALLAAIAVKWVLFFLLGFLVLQRKERYILLVVAGGIEFVSGLGFFADFRDVFLLSLVMVFAVKTRLKPRTVLLGLVLIISLGFVAAIWTVIKQDYRDFATGGDRTRQVTVVSRSEQLTKMVQLVGAVTWQDLEYAIEPLFERLAYIDFFAHTIDYVPAVREHEGGRLWMGSILHFLQPRIIFPNKPVLPSDSELTMAYTGLVLASTDQGTSFSIGYMGESYIDFGPYFMFSAIFLLGLIWGLIYYYFLKKAKNRVVGYAFASAMLLNAHTLEIATIKLFGLMAMNFLVLAMALKFGEPFIMSWIEDRRKARQASRTPVGA